MASENMEINVDSWSDALIKLLITTRLKMEYEFSSGRRKKTVLWGMVLLEMKKEIPIIFTQAELKKKFDNLKTTYKRIKLRNSSTGRDSTTWEYFGDFDEVYGSRHNISPPAKLLNSSSSSPIEENSTPPKPPKKKNEVLEFLKSEAFEDERRHKEYIEMENKKLKLEEQRIAILRDMREIFLNMSR